MAHPSEACLNLRANLAIVGLHVRRCHACIIDVALLHLASCFRSDVAAVERAKRKPAEPMQRRLENLG